MDVEEISSRLQVQKDRFGNAIGRNGLGAAVHPGVDHFCRRIF